MHCTGGGLSELMPGTERGRDPGSALDRPKGVVGRVLQPQSAAGGAG